MHTQQYGPVPDDVQEEIEAVYSEQRKIMKKV